MTTERPSSDFLSSDVQQHLDGRTLRILAYAEKFQAWFDPRAAACARLDPLDSKAIAGWFQDTLVAGLGEFGQNFPVIQAITTADAHLSPEAELTASSKLLRHLRKSADALYQVQYKFAADDAVEAAVFEPLYPHVDDIGSTLISQALLIMLQDRKISPEQAYRKAISLSWRQLLGRHPPKF